MKLPMQGPIRARAASARPKPSAPVERPAAADSLRRVLPAALYRLGRTQVELKDWAAAGVTLDRLLTEFPDNPYRREARYLRAESALRSRGRQLRRRKVSRRCSPSRRPLPIPREWSRRVRLKRIQCWVDAETLERRTGGSAAREGRAAGGRPVDCRARLHERTGVARPGSSSKKHGRHFRRSLMFARKASWRPRRMLDAW